jgi:hypothetical protein
MQKAATPDPIVQNNPTYQDKNLEKESAIYQPPQQDGGA